jgi:single-strand DNA-binding protein
MINKAIIIGNLGAAPETRYTPSGKQTASFSVATTEKWKNQNGAQQESTEWHRVITWGRLAEICSEYLDKGDKVYVEGKIQTRKWQDKDGVTRYTTEIVAREMKMLSSRAGQDGQSGGGYSDAPHPQGEPPVPDYPNGDDVPF